MIKVYDIICTNEECEHVMEQFVENDFEPCEVCGSEVKRLFSSFNFKLLYNNKTDICGWSDNDYATSQYWSKIKEAKARGEDVKSPYNKY